MNFRSKHIFFYSLFLFILGFRIFGGQCFAMEEDPKSTSAGINSRPPITLEDLEIIRAIKAGLLPSGGDKRGYLLKFKRENPHYTEETLAYHEKAIEFNEIVESLNLNTSKKRESYEERKQRQKENRYRSLLKEKHINSSTVEKVFYALLKREAVGITVVLTSLQRELDMDSVATKSTSSQDFYAGDFIDPINSSLRKKFVVELHNILKWKEEYFKSVATIAASLKFNDLNSFGHTYFLLLRDLHDFRSRSKSTFEFVSAVSKEDNKEEFIKPTSEFVSAVSEEDNKEESIKPTSEFVSAVQEEDNKEESIKHAIKAGKNIITTHVLGLTERQLQVIAYLRPLAEAAAEALDDRFHLEKIDQDINAIEKWLNPNDSPSVSVESLVNSSKLAEQYPVPLTKNQKKKQRYRQKQVARMKEQRAILVQEEEEKEKESLKKSSMDSKLQKAEAKNSSIAPDHQDKTPESFEAWFMRTEQNLKRDYMKPSEEELRKESKRKAKEKQR